MSERVSLDIHRHPERSEGSGESHVAVITVDNPPVNALSPGVPDGIQRAVEAAGQDPAVRGVVLIGAGATFIAGADIKELGRASSGGGPRGPGLGPLLQALEDCPKPVVAAIHGTAFGGGLEVAMACHYRVAAPTAQVGQPEVKLGLIPGAGGTQRLPRLAGMAKALEMCVQGDPVSAADALRHGIIDAIVEGDLRREAAAFILEKAAQGGPYRRTRDRDDRLGDPASNAPLFAAARAGAQKRGRGLLAPGKAIEALEAARLPFEEGLQREAELFRECLFSSQSKALIHIFFAERAAARVPDVPRDTPAPAVRQAAVVGAGTMGTGIAMVYANAGIPVVLAEADAKALERGLAAIRKTYASSVEKGRLSQEAADQRLARIRPTLGLDGFAEVDVVVEAVFESMDLKKQVFAELDRVCGPDAILASNTSSLDVDAIASVTSRPQQVIGHHFFAPPHLMRLLEIVRGRATGVPVLARSLALARKLGKVGVVVGNARGFVGNRMYACYQREAQFLVEEGARIPEVDAALVGFGMALGPLATGDLSGLDVGWRVRQEHGPWGPPGAREPRVADRLCERGRFGQKTGAGWYRYQAGDRTPVLDPEVDALVADEAAAAGITPRAIGPEEIVERTIYALVNEAARILEDGMALRAGDIDVVYVNGYGFPAHRGGPLFYADTVGLARVYDRIRQLEADHGELWRPAALLKTLAEQAKTFADFDSETSPAAGG